MSGFLLQTNPECPHPCRQYRLCREHTNDEYPWMECQDSCSRRILSTYARVGNVARGYDCTDAGGRATPGAVAEEVRSDAFRDGVVENYTCIFDTSAIRGGRMQRDVYRKLGDRAKRSEPRKSEATCLWTAEVAITVN